MRRRAAIATLAASTLLLSGCATKPLLAADDDRLQVVTTTGLLRDLVQQVGGDRVDAVSLVPDGGDPHTYEPTMRDARNVVYADVAFSNYALLEEHNVIKTLDANLQPDAVNVSLAEEAVKYAAEIIPLVENVNLDTVWLGLRAHGDGGDRYGATRTSEVLLSATDITGPGDVFAYLTGTFNLFGREHDVTLGTQWSDLEATTNTTTLNFPTDWARCGGDRCYYIPNVYDWNGDISEVTYTRTGGRRVAKTTQSGIYLATRLRLADPLSLIAGARLSRWETRSRSYSTTGAYTGTSGAYKVSDEVTPYVGLVYDITPNVSAYASYTEIFNPQNFKDKNENLLAPVQGSNVEAGIKTQWLDGRLTANAAVFEAKQDNYAVRDMSVPDNSLSDGTSAYIGVNGTKARGWEMDINGEILPGWTVNAGYTHVKVTRATTDLLYANPAEDLLQLNTQVRLPGALDRLSVGAGVQWQSKVQGYNIPYPLGGTVTVNQPAYALVQFNANYRISDNWTATLSVRNALDKTYWANLDYNNYGEPRFVAASLRWKF